VQQDFVITVINGVSTYMKYFI